MEFNLILAIVEVAKTEIPNVRLCLQYHSSFQISTILASREDQRLIGEGRLLQEKQKD